MDAPQIAGDKSGGVEMITLTREEAQQVLDALEKISMGGHPDWANDVTPILRARLARPEPEPVAWYWSRGVEFTIAFEEMDGHAPLYLHPPQREWQELTDEEIKRYKPVCADLDSFRAGVKAVEAKLKEKNA
jgi:hypothetical protein